MVRLLAYLNLWSSDAIIDVSQVSTLYLFKKIMAEEKTLPREQPYKDLVALINFLLRKFFKAVEEDSFLIVEVRSYAPHHQLQMVRPVQLRLYIGFLPQEPRTLEAILIFAARCHRPSA